MLFTFPHRDAVEAFFPEPHLTVFFDLCCFAEIMSAHVAKFPAVDKHVLKP